MQNRFRSPVAWASVVALLLTILKTYGLFPAIGLDEGSFREIFDLLFAVLIAFGIFNNPTDTEKF